MKSLTRTRAMGKVAGARGIAQGRAALKANVAKTRYIICRAEPEGPKLSDSIDEDSIGGDWPANWSLASYEDVGEYYAGKMTKEGLQMEGTVGAIMRTDVICAKDSDSVQNVTGILKGISGAPVMDGSGKLVGVVSKKDLAKKGGKVSDVMTSPAITIKKKNTVAEAAAIMLKYKVDRLPVVTGTKVEGIVSRKDIFTALESGEEY